MKVTSQREMSTFSSWQRLFSSSSWTNTSCWEASKMSPKRPKKTSSSLPTTSCSRAKWVIIMILLGFFFYTVFLFFCPDSNCDMWAFFMLFIFSMCRGLRARNQWRKSPSRWKLSKSKRSPKKSRQRWWTRYRLEIAVGKCLSVVCMCLTLPMCCCSQGPPKYAKSVMKKGDKTNFPKKGDTVSCWYTGSLEDGTVFDTNIATGMPAPDTATPHSDRSDCKMGSFDLKLCLLFCFLHAAAKKKKQAKPLSFKVGMGKVIRGVSRTVVSLFFSLHAF